MQTQTLYSPPGINPGAMSLKVLILKDTLSARTGASKLTLEIARAFADAGDDVRVVFFHDDGSSHLMHESANGLKIEIFERGLHSGLSKILQSPVMKIFMKDAFTLDDAVNLLGELSYTRTLNASKEGPDLIIFMNMWSGIPAVFMSNRYRSHSVLYFHEPPTFSGLPLPVRVALRWYLRLLLNRISTNVSITEATRSAMERGAGIRSRVVPDAFRILPVSGEKEDFVLLDTRWTWVRNPFFLIEVARLAEGIRFKMCGSFASAELKEQFISELRLNGVADRVEVHDNLRESELGLYYSKAKCYLRWSNSKISETGPSYGVIQAVSNGCIPVVSRNLGSSQYVSEHLGSEFVVDNDPGLFAGVVKSLFADGSFYAQSLSRLLSWRNSYDWNDYRRELIGISLENATGI